MRGAHVGEGVEAHAPIADPARRPDGGFGETPAEAKALEFGADVEAIHLRDIPIQRPQADPAGEPAVDPGIKVTIKVTVYLIR